VLFFQLINCYKSTRLQAIQINLAGYFVGSEFLADLRNMFCSKMGKIVIENSLPDTFYDRKEKLFL